MDIENFSEKKFKELNISVATYLTPCQVKGEFLYRLRP